jgi:hypothetical protein
MYPFGHSPPETVRGWLNHHRLAGRAQLNGRTVEDERKSVISIQSLQRFVDPRDIAALAEFIASDSGKSLPSQMLPIDNDMQMASWLFSGPEDRKNTFRLVSARHAAKAFHRAGRQGLRQALLSAPGRAKNVIVVGANASSPADVAEPARFGNASLSPSFSSLPFNWTRLLCNSAGVVRV